MSATHDAIATNLERANALMEELQDLAAAAVEAGVVSEDEYARFDPYLWSDRVVEIDNAVVDRSATPEELLQQSELLVAQITESVQGYRERLGLDTGARNRRIALTTVATAMGAVIIVGFLAYMSRSS